MNDIRNKAMENLAETTKRKNENDDGSPKRKKSRSTGSDTLAFLREKLEQDNQMKQIEFNAKKEESQTLKMLIESQQTQQIQQQQIQQNMLQMFAQQQQAMFALIQKMNDNK